uniref:Ig-like domain-containing protein n=1 Tax=Xenopus tropicalis TaxID=8364 RepID=A0A803JPU7_XENTR
MGQSLPCPSALSLTGLCLGINVDQNPKLLAVRAGSPVRLRCRHSDSSYIPMFWYRQRPGEGLKLMVYSAGAGMGDMEEEFKSWKLERPEVLGSNLSLESAGSSHRAAYFCAVSSTASPYCPGGASKPHSNCQSGLWVALLPAQPL